MKLANPQEKPPVWDEYCNRYYSYKNYRTHTYTEKHEIAVEKGITYKEPTQIIKTVSSTTLNATVSTFKFIQLFIINLLYIFPLTYFFFKSIYFNVRSIPYELGVYGTCVACSDRLNCCDTYVFACGHAAICGSCVKRPQASRKCHFPRCEYSGVPKKLFIYNHGDIRPHLKQF